MTGRPRPKGSLEAYSTGRFADTPESIDWRAHVASVCRVARREAGWSTTPADVSVSARFYFEPAGERLRPGSIGTGDADKLVRNVLDALSACDKRCPRRKRYALCSKHAAVYGDDAQVCDVDAKARYIKPGMAPGVFLLVRELMDWEV